ncbi:MAG: hypothetical protein EXX96DRAFT_471815 [Benjaminiella poitrasii]|nr:MAG: hypothetical protein EXX96DRAFT_471815 [Benjaminiella poitrasii]
MAGCTGDDPELFNQEWASACAWWTEHKNDKCDAGTITTTTTTTKAATTTTTTTKTTTTTTKTTTTSTKTTTTTTKTTTKAAATTTSAATNCNPSYNVPGSTECYTNCNIQAGQKWVSGWTMDHTSPLFLDSLALMCDRTGANYGSFMATAGMCMAGCTGDDPELFNQEWASACAWWAEHKADTCDAGTATSTATGGDKTVTKTVTVSACPTTSPSSCQTGFSGKKNGMGPEGACCTHSNDCQESCIKGKCNAPIASTCYTWSIGRRRGDGFNGACCSHSDDCWESCVNGKCNGPSLAECTMGSLGKRKGNGPKGACCTSSRDCKNSCIKGNCN